MTRLYTLIKQSIMNEKKRPEDYQPPDCRLVAVSVHASNTGLSVPRIYQLFQEGKLVIVSITGKQFVKLPLIN